LESAGTAALDALREVTQGLFPAVLTRRGLGPALRAHAARTGSAGRLSVESTVDDRRFGERAEAAAYFCVVTMLDGPAPVRVGLADGCLVVAGAAADRQAVVDRVETAGGRLSGGRRGTLRARFPLPVQDPLASAQTAASRSVPNAD